VSGQSNAGLEAPQPNEVDQGIMVQRSLRSHAMTVSTKIYAWGMLDLFIDLVWIAKEIV
jgi:hypothetical protein